MYKEYRPIVNHGAKSVSVPSYWASQFSRAGRISAVRALFYTLDRRWRLISKVTPKSGRLLDAGCGSGDWVAFISSKGLVAEGLDYSNDIVKNLQKIYPTHSWVQGSIQEIPLPDEVYDTVISWGVIEHDESGPLKALQEFHRVLRPKGHMVVTVPWDTQQVRMGSRAQFGVFDAKSDSNHAFFQYFMTKQELSAYIKQAGFDVLEVGAWGGAGLGLYFPKTYLRLLKVPILLRVLNFMTRLLLCFMPNKGHMIYCLAMKDE